MSSNNDNKKAPDGRRVLGMILLSVGLYAIVLGWTLPLALLSWPGALSNDASLGPFLLAAFLLVSGSLLILVSLFFLKVTLVAGYWGASGSVACPLCKGKAVSEPLGLLGTKLVPYNWSRCTRIEFDPAEPRTRNKGISVADAAYDWCECCHCVCCSLRVRTNCSS